MASLSNIAASAAKQANYLSYLLQRYPSLTRQGRINQQCYILSNSLSQKMLNTLGDLEGKVVVDINTGPGLLTQDLLQKTKVKMVISLEESRIFQSSLIALGAEYSGRLAFIPTNVSKMFSTYAHISPKQILCDSLKISIAPYEPGTPSKLHIVGVCGPNAKRLFWNSLIKRVMLESELMFLYGRPHILMWTQKDGVGQLMNLPPKGKPNTISLLSTLLYDIEVVDTLPAKAQGLGPLSSEDYCLVQMKPSANVFTRKERETLLYMARLMTIRSRNSVREAMELCAAGASRLIGNTPVDPNTLITDMTPHELLALARAFCEWEHMPSDINSLNGLVEGWSDPGYTRKRI